MNKKKISGIKKVTSICLLFLLFFNSILAQNDEKYELSDIKDLKEQFYLTSSDSIRARMAVEISTAYRLIIEKDSCKKYATMAYRILENINDDDKKNALRFKKIRAKAIENYGTILAYENAKKAVDTLQFSLQLWKETGNKLGIATAYSSLAMAYSFSSMQIDAIEYFSKSLPLYKELKKKTEEADILYLISLEKRYLGKYGDALEFSLKSLKVAEEIKDTTLITNALLGNSFNYVFAKNYTEALQEQEKALRLYQLSKDSIGIATAYNDMGVTNLYANKLEEALKYHKMALDLRKRVDESGIAISYNYIAGIYRDLGELNKALKTIKEGLSYSLKIADNRFILNSYEEAGNIYVELKDYEQAIVNYNLGLEVAKKNNNKKYQAIFLARLGQVQKKAGNLKQALSFLKQAEENIPQNDYNIRKFIYEIMTKTYEEENDLKNAFRYQAKFYQIKDSLEAIKKDEKITRLTQELIYENKNALQKANQEKQIALKESQIQKEKLIRNLSIGGLLFILVLAILLFKRFKEKRELSLSLEKTLSDLKGTQKQLIQSEKMASLGELTAGIAHEIQNPLNFVNNFSEVSNELLDEMNEELDKGDIEEAKAISTDIKLNLEKITHHGKRADGIVKGMLAHSRSSSGNKVSTDLNALCDEYLRLSYHGLRAKDKSFNASFETDFDPDLPKVNIVSQDIGRVLLNLINNAFQACAERSKNNEVGYIPKVSITTKLKANDQLLIAIKDNGSGIPENIKEKIFQPFFTTKPTGQGTGLGLSMSYDIVKAHGGELKVETEENKGSAFIIQIPLA